MNSLTLRAVVAELAPFLGRRVSGVSSVDEWELHLHLDGDDSVVVCVHPEHNSLYVTGTSEPTPAAGSPFAKRLEKALTGSRWTAVAQAGLDRMVALTFERRDRLGDARRTHLLAELTGKAAGLLLIDGPDAFAGKVIDVLRDPQGNRVGDVYVPPSSPKPDVSTASLDELSGAAKESMARRGSEPKALVAAWSGVSPLIAWEVWRRAEGDPDPLRLAEAWMVLVDRTHPGNESRDAGSDYQPVVFTYPRGRREALCFMPAGTGDGTGEAVATVCEAAGIAHRSFRERLGARAASPLRKSVQQALRRVERGFAALDLEEKEAATARDLRETGEALLASAHHISKGMTEAEIEDPHGGGTRTVRLNPKLSAGANAELYFKRARKADRKGEMLAERRRELAARRDALEDLSRRLAEFEADAPPAAWLQEAKRQGVKLPRATIEKATDLPPEERLESALRPRSYDLGEGWKLLVGKSNRGNEVLTHEIARPAEIWMHADQAAGSHCVLRHHEKGKEPPRPILLAAAAIAAFFSKARNSSKVSVIVSHKRHVRRPRKAPLGTVTVGEHRTLMVTPKNPEAKKES